VNPTVRLYVRTARKLGSAEATEFATLHAFCPCALPRKDDNAFPTLGEATAAADLRGLPYTVCKRSTEPVAAQAETAADHGEPVTETAAEAVEITVEPVAAQAETAADHGEPVTETVEITVEPEDAEDATLMGEVRGLLAVATRPGLSEGTVRGLLADAVEAVVRGYTDPAADRTDTVTSFSVNNLDAIGAARRDAVADLVRELGGATDAHSLKNQTGTGIRCFVIEIFAPRFVADALDLILPVLAERQALLRAVASQAARAQPRAARTGGDNRPLLRAWTRSFGQVLSERAASASARAGLGIDVTPHETAARANATERRLASKAARGAAAAR